MKWEITKGGEGGREGEREKEREVETACGYHLSGKYVKCSFYASLYLR